MYKDLMSVCVIEPLRNDVTDCHKKKTVYLIGIKIGRYRIITFGDHWGFL